MKRKIFFCLSLITLILTGCSSVLDVVTEEQNTSTKLTAVIPSFLKEDATRLSVSSDLKDYYWSTGDQIGLYYDGTDSYVSAVFTVRNGGSSVGSFYNEGFTLNPNSSYYVFYPYSSSATATEANLNYNSQTQTENNGTSHILAKDYMLSTITTDASSNPSDVNFQHIGSILQFIYTPSAGTYKTMTVKASKTPFKLKTKLNMTNGALATYFKAYTQTLNLDNITISEGEELVLNLATIPVNQSSSILTVTLTDVNGNKTVYTHNGKNMKAGFVYSFTDAKPTTSTLVAGPTFNKAIKTLAKGSGVNYISADALIQTINFVVNSDVTTGTIVSTADSKGDIFANYSDGVLTISTEAPVIKLGPDASYLFNYLTALTTINGLENVDTSDVTDMNRMFRLCSSLTSVNLSGFDTSNVTNMQGMFSNCSALGTLDISNFDTEKVTNYQSMFNSCSGLTTLTMGNKFLISSSANTKTMASGLAVVSGAATITCMKATQTAIKASTDFPTVPTFTWVLLDGGGSYEAGGEGYPWG